MSIEINIPRPLLTLTLIAVFAFGMVAGGGKEKLASLIPDLGETQTAEMPTAADPAPEPARGGDTTPVQERVKRAEDDARLARLQREVLDRKADIFRGELRMLEAEKKILGELTPEQEKQFSDSTRILNSLLQDQKKAEQFLLASLNQIWEAQGRAIAWSGDTDGSAVPTLDWPIDPKLGISAFFHDPKYEDRFGFPHDAIDIPALQLSLVRAAGDGVVKDVVDHGLGFNYITIKHSGGIVTLYGHVTEFIVHPGDIVRAGDPIAYSGGRPGTAGAGLSTGPHLHFGVFRAGVAVNPMSYLPPAPAPEESGATLEK